MHVPLHAATTVRAACTEAVGQPVTLYHASLRTGPDRIELRTARGALLGWFRLRSTERRPTVLEVTLCR